MNQGAFSGAGRHAFQGLSWLRGLRTGAGRKAQTVSGAFGPLPAPAARS